MSESIYYIFGKDTPTVFHSTILEAETEARRLARKHPGIEFYILRVVRSIRYVSHPFIETSFKK